MPRRNNLFLILLIAILLSTSGYASAQETTGGSSYLPLITIDRDRWIGPEGGYITSIAIHPTNPAILYAGTWGAGMFRSRDGGTHWETINEDLDALYINSLAINPSTPTTLYVGSYKQQVYKSTDGGDSWIWSGNGMQVEAIVYALAIDPQQPHVLYAGTRGISNNGNPPWKGILYKSVDSGGSWRPILEDLGGAESQDWVYSIAIHPTDTSSLYIATHEHGPFRSNDYGETWFAIHDGIIDDSGRAIVISPDTSETTTLYYGVWHFDAVYKSDNGGNDWYTANRGILDTKVYSMAIDPKHPERVYLGTFNRGLLKTLDGGLEWESAGLAKDLIYAIKINPTSTDMMYAGTSGDGLYKSLDAGTTWGRINSGIQNSMATKVIVLTSSSKMLLTSTYGSGVFLSKDLGKSWLEMNTGLGDTYVHGLVQDPAHPQIVYALTNTNGLYRVNMNDSLEWVKVGQGLPSNIASTPSDSASPVLNPLGGIDLIEIPEKTQIQSTSLLVMAFSSSAANTAYIGTGGSGVYKSADGGNTWHPAGLDGEIVQSLAVGYANPDLIYAVTLTPGSLKVSLDGGINWTEATFPVKFYTAVTIPTLPANVYVGTDDGVYIYQSGSFTQIGLAGMSVTAIAIDPTNPQRIFAGTNSGAFYTTDGGSSWKKVAVNLEGFSIRSVDIDSSDLSWVYFSTETHGIYQASVEK